MHKYTEKRIIKMADYESRHIEYCIEGHDDSVIEQVSSVLDILEREVRRNLSAIPVEVIDLTVVEEDKKKALIKEKEKTVLRDDITVDDMRNVINKAIDSGSTELSDVRDALTSVGANKIDNIDPANYEKVLSKLGLGVDK